MKILLCIGVICFGLVIIEVANWIDKKVQSKIPLSQKDFFNISEVTFTSQYLLGIFNELKEKYYNGEVLTDEEYNEYETRINVEEKDEFTQEIFDSLIFALNNRDIKYGWATTDKIQLKPKELEYYRSPNAVVDKADVILRNINYCGFRLNRNAFRMGNMLVSSNEINGIKRFGNGWLYVTNQRIVFVGTDNATISIPLGSIISYAAYEDNGVVFSIANKKPIIVSFPLDGQFKNTHTQAYGVLYNDSKYKLLYALDKVFELRK